jgi:hypothetical protein
MSLKNKILIVFPVGEKKYDNVVQSPTRKQSAVSAGYGSIVSPRVMQATGALDQNHASRVCASQPALFKRPHRPRIGVDCASAAETTPDRPHARRRLARGSEVARLRGRRRIVAVPLLQALIESMRLEPTPARRRFRRRRGSQKGRKTAPNPLRPRDRGPNLRARRSCRCRLPAPPSPSLRPAKSANQAR